MGQVTASAQPEHLAPWLAQRPLVSVPASLLVADICRSMQCVRPVHSRRQSAMLLLVTSVLITPSPLKAAARQHVTLALHFLSPLALSLHITTRNRIACAIKAT